MMAAWADALMRCSLQGGLAAIIVLAVTRLFPRTPAAVQAWLWRIVAIKFLLGVALQIPYFTQAPSFALNAQLDPTPVVIVAAFVVGASLAVVALLRDGLALRALKQNSIPAELPETQALAARIGCKVPEVRIKADLDRPLLVGIRRPMIYLPSDLDESAREMVLAHELAHLRRRDLAWEWLFIALETIFFFHPLAWLAHREHRKAQETACDAMVLRACRASTADYGRMLLKLTISEKQRELTLAANMAGTYAALHARIVRLHRGHVRLTFLGSLALAAIALAILPTWRLTIKLPEDASATSRIDPPIAGRRAMPLKEGRP